MTNEELVWALRCCSKHERRCLECEFLHNGYCSLQLDAAAAIEELQAVLKEADKKQAYQHDCICELTAENAELQDELDQWKAAVKGQEDGIKVLQAEVKRLQGKLCDWCAVCPIERRNPDDCELLGENPVMYGPSGAKMGVQDGSKD